MPTEPDDDVATCNLSAAVTDTLALDRLALSPAKALTDPPTLKDAESEATDTESPEYTDNPSDARRVADPLDKSNSSDTDTLALSPDIDTDEPDDSDTAPVLSNVADAPCTATSPPLNTSLSPIHI